MLNTSKSNHHQIDSQVLRDNAKPDATAYTDDDLTHQIPKWADPVFRQRYAIKNHVHVLFLGELAKRIGMNALELPLEQSVTVGYVKSVLNGQLVAWASLDTALWQTVNRNLAGDDAIVTMGDEVAFFIEQLL